MIEALINKKQEEVARKINSWLKLNIDKNKDRSKYFYTVEDKQEGERLCTLYYDENMKGGFPDMKARKLNPISTLKVKFFSESE